MHGKNVATTFFFRRDRPTRNFILRRDHPTRNQMILLQKLNPIEGLEITTVDNFQGEENEIIEINALETKIFESMLCYMENAFEEEVNNVCENTENSVRKRCQQCKDCIEILKEEIEDLEKNCNQDEWKKEEKHKEEIKYIKTDYEKKITGIKYALKEDYKMHIEWDGDAGVHIGVNVEDDEDEDDEEKDEEKEEEHIYKAEENDNARIYEIKRLKIPQIKTRGCE